MKEVLAEENQLCTSIQTVRVPEDAMLDFEFMDRKTSQTPSGSIVEVYIQRKKKIEKSPFKAARFAGFEQKIRSVVPLTSLSEPNDEMSEGKTGT